MPAFIPRPGQIYWAMMEQQGGPRPVLVVSKEHLNRGHYAVVIPFTTTRHEERSRMPTSVPFKAGESGLTKDCVARAEGIMTIQKDDIDSASGMLGELSDEKLRDVVRAIGCMIDAECEPV